MEKGSNSYKIVSIIASIILVLLAALGMTIVAKIVVSKIKGE